MNAIKNNKPRILLVEDELVVQKIHRELLEKIGYAVDTASTGAEALEKSSRGYNLIFMDLGLPDIGGVQVAKIIRAHEKNGNRVPIIGLTAFPIEEVQSACINAGMDCVYNKPISPEKLAEIITEYDKSSLMN
ncbi:MAG TPA: response regulator [Gammaproteobacteria bacterium]|jgi:CheY-like chemotaxis protein|nr:response regulator [Gammaproteobacteria bacterium]